jgi:hypothetical protein
MTDNKWIVDFHKALEERKEPPKQFTPPSPKEATNPFLNHPVPDWVKRMGQSSPKALDNGPASILRAQVTAADWPWRTIRNVA